jgi:hypothetical protein
MGRRGYPPEFRRKVLDLVEAGRPIAEVAKVLGISDQDDLYLPAARPRIDRSLEPGLTRACNMPRGRSPSVPRTRAGALDGLGRGLLRQPW